MTVTIGILSESGMFGSHPFFRIGVKYVRALYETTGAFPMLLPADPEILHPDILCEKIDGLLVPGGVSNIERQRYGMPPAPAGETEDPARDQASLSLLPALIERGMPLFGICRGMQELNVALGGSLFPRVHEIEGRFDHREDKDAPLDIQYAPVHTVDLRAGGLLSEITGQKNFMVNSVHGQAIDRLADGLVAEATAEDGTIEAVSSETSPGFILATQWHPEWQAARNPNSVLMFKRFVAEAKTFSRAHS